VGAIITTGGLGVKLNANVGGDLGVGGTLGVKGNAAITGTADITGNTAITGTITQTDTTASTTSTTGAIITTGGLGVKLNANVGGTLGVKGNAAITGTLSVGANTAVVGDLSATLGAFSTLSSSTSATIASATGNKILIDSSGTASTDKVEISAGGLVRATIAGSTGKTTITDLVAQTADIGGGSINGASVGSTAVSTGKFSTLSVNGALSGSEVLTVTGSASFSSSVSVTNGPTLSSSGISKATTIASEAGVDIKLAPGSGGTVEVNSAATFKFGTLKASDATIQTQNPNTDIILSPTGTGKVVVTQPLQLTTNAHISCTSATQGMILLTGGASDDTVTICIKVSGTFVERTLSFT
jgi:hypothetical protein